VGSRTLRLAALVLVGVLVIHVRLLAGGDTWDDPRYHAEIAPPRLAAADAVLAGELPAWWEGSGLGVPLAAEPMHGAMYPPTWIAATPRALDLVGILHAAWAALGIALWARRRWQPRGEVASEPAAVVVAVLAVGSGLVASLAMRGALVGIAHLPWIGLATAALVDAPDRAARARATVLLGVTLGLVALSGVLAALVDALAIALVLGARRRTLAPLAIAIAGGLAIGLAQWLPAILQLGAGAGAEVGGISPGRLVELIVPGSFGAGDPERAIAAVAGERPWAPSLFVGAGLLALAAVRTPSARVRGLLVGLAALALVAGRGGWPAWTGAPEVHLAALVVVLAAHAAGGIDALLDGERRALLAVTVGVACSAVALGAFAALRARNPAVVPAIDRALLDGGIGLGCLAIALVVAWRARRRAMPIVLALLVLPSVGALRSTAPTVDRAIVDQPSAWAQAALARPHARAPRRLFRPAVMHDTPERTADAMATLAGTAGWRWGIAAARSDDPARLPEHDRTWLAASREGGALLDRFGVALAILPDSLVLPRKLTSLASRGTWALVELPVAPPAGVLRGARWSIDPANTLELMYPRAGGTGVLRGTIVLKGAGTARDDQGPPLPCTIARWDAGAIDVTCTTDAPGYAAVSSSAAAGWTATVDGRATPWLTADVLRRAVPIDAGTHAIRWRYRAPGLRTGLLVAAIALLGLFALVLAAGRRPRPLGVTPRDN